MRHKTYSGKRFPEITVETTEAGVPRELDPEPSRKIRNHSPDGFEWGYGGSGPAQLALAILLDYFIGAREGEPSKYSIGSPEDSAAFYYQNFKSLVVARFGDSWELSTREIEDALHMIRERRNG